MDPLLSTLINSAFQGKGIGCTIWQWSVNPPSLSSINVYNIYAWVSSYSVARASAYMKFS